MRLERVGRTTEGREFLLDDKVHRQYFGWTQTSGSGGWGLPHGD